MFDLIVTICAAICASLVALGIIIFFFSRNRTHKVVLGVALCLLSIIGISAAFIILFNHAPETAYNNHINQLDYENPVLTPRPDPYKSRN